MKRLLKTSAPAATILIRLLVGAVFLSEGIQKFLFPDVVGAGRFAKIGFESPELTAGFVGTVEIICGSLVLLGMCMRVAVIPLIVIMLTAMTTTKLPILADQGFWKMAHESRTVRCFCLSLDQGHCPSMSTFLRTTTRKVLIRIPGLKQGSDSQD